MKKKLLHMTAVLFILSGCTTMQQSTPTYEETKKMVTDALQTEEGKKAIQQMLADSEFREQLILDQDEVKKSIEQTMLSEEGKTFWKKTFEDPKFAETVAKSMKEQQQEIMKQLMEDASFQKDLESFFGQPDMQKQLETILQSATMKEQYAKAVEETIQSPLLQSKWEKLIQEAGGGQSDESKSGGEGGKPEGEKSKEKSGEGQ